MEAENDQRNCLEEVQSFEEIFLELEQILKTLFQDVWIPYFNECNLTEVKLLDTVIEYVANIKSHILAKVHSKYNAVEYDKEEITKLLRRYRRNFPDHKKDTVRGGGKCLEEVQSFEEIFLELERKLKSLFDDIWIPYFKECNLSDDVILLESIIEHIRNIKDQIVAKVCLKYKSKEDNTKGNKYSFQEQNNEDHSPVDVEDEDDEDEFSSSSSSDESDDEFDTSNSDSNAEWIKEEINSDENQSDFIDEPTEAEKSLTAEICGNKVLRVILKRLKITDRTQLKMLAKLKSLKLGKLKEREEKEKRNRSKTKVNKRRQNKPKYNHENLSINCPICKEEFKAEDFETHVQEIHRYSSILVFKSDFPSVIIPIQCKQCQMWLENMTQLAEHELTKCRIRFKCKQCPRVFPDKKTRNQHSKTHVLKQFSCSVCKKSFKSKAHLKEHKRVHSDDRPFKCDKCSDTFKFAVVLRNHIEAKHSDGVPCPTCNKVCSTRSKLKRHIKAVHEKVRPWICKQCDKAFFDAEHLKRHIATHRPRTEIKLKPFSCQICSKSFHEKAILNQHIRTHSEERPYKCEKCPDAFKSSSVLKTHVEARHPVSGAKSAQCPICFKFFTTKNHVKSHMEGVHATEKSHLCEQCGKCFKRKVDLKRHIATHNNPLGRNYKNRVRAEPKHGRTASGKPRRIRNKKANKNNIKKDNNVTYEILSNEPHYVHHMPNEFQVLFRGSDYTDTHSYQYNAAGHS